jgi:GSH-dependent disulfide-bond oxidoreductase
MMQPIDLYYWPTPNGWKITIALEEMGVSYRVIPVNIGTGDQFKPDFLAISPNNRIPAIVDHDTADRKPISVFESGAILQYLGRKTGQFYPQDERGRIEVEQWLMWQMGGLGPMTGQANHFQHYAPERVEYGVNRYTNEARRLFGVMDKRLADRDYVAGAYSIADMAAIGWIKAGDRLGIDLADFPHLKRWSERMHARPAVIRGLAVKVDAPNADPKSPEVQKILFGNASKN